MSVPFDSAFAHRVAEDGILIAEETRLAALAAEGLDREAVWRDHTAPAAPSEPGEEGRRPGRGGTTVLELSPSGSVRLKQLRRGGLLAPLWRERFFGTSRLLANLEIPFEAAERGVPTPAAVALFLAPGPPGFYRGWLATEEIEGAVDLWRLLASAGADPAATVPAMKACDAAIRKMHAAGLDHTDLNIGNLLVCGDEAYVIDLDRCRLGDRPVAPARRTAARARLERSYRKHLQPGPAELERFREALGGH